MSKLLGALAACALLATLPGPAIGQATGGDNPEDVPPDVAIVCDFTGTPFNDVIRGTSGGDLICANGGNDVVYGMGGSDSLFGGPGNDVLRGGSGSDFLSGEWGSDILLGEDGPDRLSTAPNQADFPPRSPARIDGGRNIADGGRESDGCRTDAGDIRRSC